MFLVKCIFWTCWPHHDTLTSAILGRLTNLSVPSLPPQTFWLIFSGIYWRLIWRFCQWDVWPCRAGPLLVLLIKDIYTSLCLKPRDKSAFQGVKVVLVKLWIRKKIPFHATNIKSKSFSSIFLKQWHSSGFIQTWLRKAKRAMVWAHTVRRSKTFAQCCVFFLQTQYYIERHLQAVFFLRWQMTFNFDYLLVADKTAMKNKYNCSIWSLLQ